MKKILALLLAVFMVVGLFAGCGGDKPVETQPPKEPQAPKQTQAKPVETEPPAAQLPEVSAPVADTAYKFGLQQNGLDGKVYYFTGEESGNYLATSTSLSDAAPVYLEQAEGGYYLYCLKDGVKKYDITYQYVGDDAASFTVNTNTRNKNYTMSLDNFGGVVTVYEY